MKRTGRRSKDARGTAEHRWAPRQPVLPDDLAPALAERVRRLLSEVGPPSAPELHLDQCYPPPRCVVCFGGGKLGGHHDEHGQVQWVHRSCHRRLHRRGWVPRRHAPRLLADLAIAELALSGHGPVDRGPVDPGPVDRGAG